MHPLRWCRSRAPLALKPCWALDDLLYRLGLPNVFDLVAPYRGNRGAAVEAVPEVHPNTESEATR